MNITYNITDCSGSEDYDVRLFLRQNGDLTEIKCGLSGDIEHVTCGSSNTIVWDVLNDREELKGPIFFAVEILRTHPLATDESPIAYESGDSRRDGAVPYGDPADDESESYPRQNTYPQQNSYPRQNVYPPPFGFFQLGARIAFEQARAAILSHGRPTVIFQKPSGSSGSWGSSSPQRTRRR